MLNLFFADVSVTLNGRATPKELRERYFALATLAGGIPDIYISHASFIATNGEAIVLGSDGAKVTDISGRRFITLDLGEEGFAVVDPRSDFACYKFEMKGGPHV